MPVRGELLFQKEISQSADNLSDDLAGLKGRTAQVSDAQDQPGWLSCMYSCSPLDPSLPEMAWVSQFVPLLNVTTLDTSQYYLSLCLLRMSSLGLSRPSLSPRNSGNRATGGRCGSWGPDPASSSSRHSLWHPHFQEAVPASGAAQMATTGPPPPSQDLQGLCLLPFHPELGQLEPGRTCGEDGSTQAWTLGALVP